MKQAFKKYTFKNNNFNIKNTFFVFVYILHMFHLLVGGVTT